VLTAARLREDLGVPGMSYETVLRFRDKEKMKERLREKKLRVPHSARVRTRSEALAAAETIGFPLILKPIAGAGSADTYRVNDAAELEKALGRTGHVVEASLEEFVEGDEFTYDTICIDGVPVYENVAQYLPRPLDARSHEWISPIIITVSDLSQPAIAPGIAFGRKCLKALGMGTGFTHMEWYRTAKGEIVFGEVGCRPGGAHLVDQMNYTSDIDLFREWARAAVHKKFDADARRKYNCAIIFKRAMGQGRITRIEGAREFASKYANWMCVDNLLPVGAHRRDWKQTLVSDGFLIVRHPEWAEAKRMAEEAAVNIRMYAQ
jgi:biotin carboxylase